MVQLGSSVNLIIGGMNGSRKHTFLSLMTITLLHTVFEMRLHLRGWLMSVNEAVRSSWIGTIYAEKLF